MGTVVAIGPANEIAGFALVGVELRPACDDESARRIWASLGRDVALAIVAASVARALDSYPATSTSDPLQPLRVVIPS